MELSEQFVALKAARRFDEAWCVADALEVTGTATTEASAFHKLYRPQGLKKAVGTLPWRRIEHPAEDIVLTARLASEWRQQATPLAQRHKAVGVKRKHRRDLETDPLMVSKLLVYVGVVCDVTLPEVFLLDEQGEPLEPVMLIDDGELCPSWLCRPESLQGLDQLEVAFLMTQRMTFMRPGYILRHVVPDLDGRWVAAVDATARRAGMIIAGSLAVAARHSPPDALDDLVAFWTSDDHFAIRKEMRLAL